VREADGVPDPRRTTGADGSGPLVGVDDPDDPGLAPYRDLNDPAGRRRTAADRSIFVVEGRLGVERLLTSGYAVESLLVDDRQVTAVGGLVAGVRARGAPVYVASRSVVAATVGFALHRGVVAVARRPAPADAAGVLAGASPSDAGGGPAVVAVLEGLNDHENIGALFRNAAAFGVGGVLLDPTCADPLYRRSVRVSMGHVLHVPFARLGSWPGGIATVRDAGFTVVGLAPHPPSRGGPARLRLSDLRDRVPDGRARPGAAAGVALLLGAEGPGLSDGALAAADGVASIPMAEGADSLNVATAAAIAFHELRATG
jgi:tRNA G18 (ribose-2'-O)-methylase SpoU